MQQVFSTTLPNELFSLGGPMAFVDASFGRSVMNYVGCARRRRIRADLLFAGLFAGLWRINVILTKLNGAERDR